MARRIRAGVVALVALALVVAATVVVTRALTYDGGPDAPTSPFDLPAEGSWAIGWAAATRGAANRPTELVLVSPDGREQTVGQVSPNSTVVDISHDGRRILTKVVGASPDVPTPFTVWDLETGESHRFVLGHDADVLLGAGRTLVSPDVYPRSYTTIRDLRGRVVRTIPRTGESAVVSPGSTTLMYATPTGIDVVDIPTGRLVSSTRNPQPVACYPSGLWSDGAPKLWCGDQPGSENTYVVDPSTERARLIGAHQQGLKKVWPTSPVTATRTYATNGPVFVRAGKVWPVWPAPASGTAPVRDIVAGRGSTLWLTVTTSREAYLPPGQYARHDLRTGRTTVLAEGITSVQVIDGLT